MCIKLYFYLPKVVLVPSSNQKTGLADVFPLCHMRMPYVYVVEQILFFASTVNMQSEVYFILNCNGSTESHYDVSRIITERTKISFFF